MDLLNLDRGRWRGLLAGWFALLASVVSAAGTTNLVWHWSNPLPFGNNVAELIGDTNRYYLAVADHGQAYLSEDLSGWTPLKTQTRRFLRGATFHPLGTDTNASVIVGENGTILQLHGSRELSTLTLPTTDWLEGVASSGSRLVAVGDNAAIYSSDDGTNWVRRSAPISAWLRSVTWRSTAGGSGLFVAVGEGGQIIVSADGTAWTKRNSNSSADLNRVVATPTGFLTVGAGGVVLVGSADGQRWTATQSGATDDLFAATSETRTILGLSITVPLVAGAHELRSAVSRGATFLWTDELDTRRTAPAPSSSYYSALFDGTRFLLGGQAGLIISGTRSTTIDQSLLWTPVDSPPRAVLWDVTSAVAVGTNISAALVNGSVAVSTNRTTNQLYSAVGFGPTLLQSDNGVSWSTALIPASASNSVFLGVGGRSNLLVAAGSGGHLAYSPESYEPLLSTNLFTNGIIVTAVVITNYVNTLALAWLASASGVTNDLQGVGANDSLFVVTGGNGIILTSPNGQNWTRRSTPSSRFISSVDAGPAGWVAVGEAGTLWQSADGTTWTPQVSGTTNWLWRVRYLNGQYLSVGQNGTIVASPDGVHWTPGNSGVTNWLYGVHSVDGTYYSVGSQGTVLASPDSKTWTLADTLTGKPLYGLTSARGQLLAVGSEGVILRAQVGPFASPPSITKWPTNPTNQLFLVNGHMDQRFRIEKSRNLESWTPGAEVEIDSSDGAVLILDATPNASDLQYFRAAEQP